MAKDNSKGHDESGAKKEKAPRKRQVRVPKKPDPEAMNELIQMMHRMAHKSNENAPYTGNPEDYNYLIHSVMGINTHAAARDDQKGNDESGSNNNIVPLRRPVPVFKNPSLEAVDKLTSKFRQTLIKHNENAMEKGGPDAYDNIIQLVNGVNREMSKDLLKLLAGEDRSDEESGKGDK